MSIENISEIEGALRGASIQPRTLHQIWEQRRPVPELQAAKKGETNLVQIPWIQNDSELALLFAKRALEAEEFLLLCDLGREVERLAPPLDKEDSVARLRVRMLHAKALAQLGSTREARSLLESNIPQALGARLRAELLSLVGDIIREESHHVASRAARLEALREALNYYSKARDLDPKRVEIVILMAGVARVLGDETTAVNGAEETLRLASEREAEYGRFFDTDLARAAALAVLGRVDEAAAAYSSLKDSPGQTTALLAEARYRAQFLAEAADQDRDFFKAAFPPLQLLVFAGHIPSPDKSGRFPLLQVAEARDAIRKRLNALQARVGLGSAAAGGDLLFLDELLSRNAAVHVVLPWAREEFRKTSVLCVEDPAPPERGWNEQFDDSLKYATSIRELGQLYRPSDETGWQYLSEVACGLAMLTARMARLDVKPIALWDGYDGPPGGTASFVKFWTRSLGESPEIVNLRVSNDRPPQLNSSSGDRIEKAVVRQEVKSMLFADIVGYSRLTEHVIPEFIRVFMPRVALLAAGSRHAPMSINTWGDAVYAVFDYATDAGLFALELIQMIRECEHEWIKAGLYWEEIGDDGAKRKRPINVRVGLHTGPVFLHYDPVVRRLSYTGAHVNRAARIEPVARPGEVYASEEFAALSALAARIVGQTASSTRGNEGFVCEYAGTMPLAKGYPGRYRIYRVLPNRTLDIEAIAQAIHEDYCAKEELRGETIATNPVLVPWSKLPDDLKEANRAQAADIPNKLRLLGFELAPLHGLNPEEIKLPDADLDASARREHDRWADERRRQGWTFGPLRDDARKFHPLLIPWDELSKNDKEKDRDTVRNALVLAAKAGFRLRRISPRQV